MSRRLRPREPIAIAPVAVSQLSSLAVLGLDGRRYLEWLREHPEVPRTRVGKLVVTDADEMRAALRDQATAAGREIDPEALAADDDDQPEDADAVLRAIGMRRTA